MNLEQIALKVAKESLLTEHLWLDPKIEGHEEECADVTDFARRLVAELTKGQEPVAYYCGRNQFGSPQFRIGVLPITEGPLFAAPPICPTCTQMIDEAAREGRIVDDRVSDATTKAAERWETIETLWFLSGEPLELGTDDYGNAKVIFDGAECVGEVWVGKDLGAAIDRATNQLAAAPEYKENDK